MPTYTGTATTNTLTGGSGDDDIAGLGGADTLSGGDGNDRIYSDLRESVAGYTSYNPNFPTYYTIPTLDRAVGIDTVMAGAGDDFVSIGYGDSADGGAHGEHGDQLFLSLARAPTGVIADFTQTTISIGGGTITGFERVDFVEGSMFADVITFSPYPFPLYPDFGGPGGGKEIRALSGNDQVIGSYYTQSIWGGDGDDSLDASASQYLMYLAGEAGNDVLIGGLPGSIFDGGSGDDMITGGGGLDKLTGGTGADKFRDTAAGLNGDTITDFAFGDKIIITDVNLAGFTFTLTGNTLTFTGGSITLQGTLPAQLVASAASGGGVQLALPPQSIYGTSGNDTITGTGGDDRIEGSTGNDIIYGGVGNDILSGEWDNDRVYGEAGDDLINAGFGDDTYDGGAGIDTLSYQTWGWGVTVSLGISGAQNTGNYGLDTITGFENIIGSQSADVLTGDDSANWIDGGAVGSGALDTIRGAGGNDQLTGVGFLIGGDGNDTLTVRSQAVIEFHAGDDQDNIWNLAWGSQVQIHDYTAARSIAQVGDTVVLTLSDTDIMTFHGVSIELVQSLLLFMGSPGDGSIVGGPNSDTLAGGAEDNSIYGNGGADYLNGNGGNDYISGGDADDSLNGGDGDDTLEGGAGQDQLSGGDGIDTASYAGASAGVNVSLSARQPQDTVSAGWDQIWDWIENLEGSEFNDVLTGSELANALFGNAGNDILVDDAGDDTLTGGAGTDTLTAGTGNDTFKDTMFGLNGDTITDFAIGDTIVLTDASLSGFTFNQSGSTLTYTGGSLTLQGSFAGYQFVAGAAAGGGVQLTLQASVVNDVRNDFNGDGRSDILWRNETGHLAEWLGQAGGTLAYNTNAAYQLDPSWQVLGFGDFNGDGRDDILWQHNNAALMQWLAQTDGTFAWNAISPQAMQPDWHLQGIGDFNGDGRDDMLWRTDAGTITQWLGQPNGSFVANPNAQYTLPTNWQAAATGDFNGDGRDDIMWRNEVGALSEWLGQANGTFAYNPNAAYQLPTNWELAAAADFNGDGRDDILWRNEVGAMSQWLANADGTFAYNPNAAYQLPTNWELAATGDFNGDGRDDIIWRNEVGAMSQWLANADATFAYNPNAAYQLPTNWHTQPEDPLL